MHAETTQLKAGTSERSEGIRGGKPSGADAYRYLTGEAEVGGRAALLAGGGAHAAVGAAGRVLPFPPLGGGLSGGLSFGATSKDKQRQCQEHNAYRQREGVRPLRVCVCARVSARQPLRACTWTSASLGCRPEFEIWDELWLYLKQHLRVSLH